MNQAVAHQVPVTCPNTATPAPRPVLFDDSMIWTKPGMSVDTIPVRIRYRLHGPDNAPVVVALGGISANRQVQCWWHPLYGRQHSLNPENLRILSLDWLDHGPDAAAAISTAGQAGALVAVLDHLAIDRIDLLVGASYGAMVGLALAEHYPDRLQRLVAISGADRSRPFNTALRHIQREILRLGLDTGQHDRAVALARALAMTTYRPQSLFDQRFRNNEPDQVLDDVAGYLGHVGRCFSDNFDAGRYLRLSDSLDRHRVDPAGIRCPVDLVAVDSDQLVTPEQVQGLADSLGRPARLHMVSSPYGHDAFLKEPRIFNRLIGDLIDTEVLT
jgi:homoserine O-acetyltransferase/O-succinyltransferase